MVISCVFRPKELIYLTLSDAFQPKKRWFINILSQFFFDEDQPIKFFRKIWHKNPLAIS